MINPFPGVPIEGIPYTGAYYITLFANKSRLFQNFSFWKSYPRFNRKTGLLDSFSKAISKTNRVLEMAH
jgi:hypothetical protein